MKVNYRSILTDCIERGISYGYDRAHKHTSDPPEYMVKDEIENAIWNILDEYLVFNDSDWDV